MSLSKTTVCKLVREFCAEIEKQCDPDAHAALVTALGLETQESYARLTNRDRAKSAEAVDGICAALETNAADIVTRAAAMEKSAVHH